MSWKLDKTNPKYPQGVWKCTSYSDLQYVEINNLAEYGQPRSPYEPGFDHDFEPDFGNVAVEMPQQAVMCEGYGRNITADCFPIVHRFLYGPPFTLNPRTYSFADLVRDGHATNGDRVIKTNLYGGGLEVPVVFALGSWPRWPVVWLGGYGITPGNISSGDAAYIHGTVAFALMASTRFTYSRGKRSVVAEIGARDDNWDFNSKTIPPIIEGTVAVLLGPGHYNLTAEIKIIFYGAGKLSVVMV